MINSTTPFPKISFEDAFELLGNKNNYFKLIENAGLTITNAGERELIKLFGGPLWLTHFPSSTVPFYQACDPLNPKYSLTADLLMGIGETVGCGERHTNLDELDQSLKNHLVNPKEYKWYRQLKKDYPLQTSGFGMGIERYILWLLNHNDIRDIPTVNRIKGTKTYV